MVYYYYILCLVIVNILILITWNIRFAWFSYCYLDIWDWILGYWRFFGY